MTPVAVHLILPAPGFSETEASTVKDRGATRNPFAVAIHPSGTKPAAPTERTTAFFAPNGTIRDFHQICTASLADQIRAISPNGPNAAKRLTAAVGRRDRTNDLFECREDLRRRDSDENRRLAPGSSETKCCDGEISA
ncbi:MAG TPA: hypothetical protein VM165_14865 [Planctomycetaceae bacterium]|nr:hypothetical protein [Planctomycetaceae bacterium]